MFPVNPGEKFRRITFKTTVAFLAVLFIVTIGPQLLELEGSQALAKKKKKGGRYCTATAKAAHTACIREKQDDYNIAVGNCINVSDDEERSNCYQEAKSEYKEAKEECKDQYEARRDVCEDLGQGRYDPELDSANFVDNPLEIGDAVAANPYFPLIPGTTWTYENTVAGETDTVEVFNETKEFEYPADSGQIFNCIVVNDVVTDTESGEVIEDTDDWYAQDEDGNVWYFGEISKQFEDGELVSLEGSWKAGVDDAKPGIIMPADPQEGDIYRQEFFLGDAEDMGAVVSRGDESAEVPFGNYEDDVLKTKDWTPIEPDALEFKYYAPAVGLVLEVNPDTGERVELISKTP